MSLRRFWVGVLVGGCVSGCGGGNHFSLSSNGSETDGGSLVFRAANPRLLQVVQLTPPMSSPLTFTGFYGSPLTRLGYVPANGKWADKIAFASDRDGNFEIYRMDADGSNPVNLTQNPASDYAPAWTPDGQGIAFTSDRDGNSEIYVINADGSSPINLTRNPNEDLSPAWSPDGTKIAFASFRSGDWEIYVMNADGSSPVNLTQNPAPDWHPAWSPDGTRIAFETSRDGNDEIYLMDSDGSNPVNLTQNPAPDWHPAWSPDGTRIAFTSLRSGDWEIYVMNADGSHPINLTHTLGADGKPSWSPDGTKIAFYSDRIQGNDWEIYVMNADGSNPVALTHTPTNRYPAWSPVRNGSRWLVGLPGADRGNDPPFGTTTDGAILVRRGNGFISAVDIDVQTVGTLSIQGVMQGLGEEVVVAEVTADRIFMIREDRGPGIPPLVLLGSATLNAVYATDLPIVKALLDFNARTGRVMALIPLNNRSCADRLGYTLSRRGHQVVLQGDFAAVMDVPKAIIQAPEGASEVMVDAQTGEVITMRFCRS